MAETGFSKYPFDYDQLKKGDELSPEEIERITGKKPGTDEYRFAVMGLQALIQDRTGYTAKCQSDGSLKVLTDPEAAEHNRKLFAQNLRAMANRHTLNTQVDVDNLPEDARRRHDQTLMVQSRYVSAMIRTTKEITVGRSTKQMELPAPETA